jgi:putative ABC transport system substrate-binding protein
MHNPSLRPFTPPVPFLLMRHAVISDWKFFTDPVGQGIVASLAHPGSNVTGFQDFEISFRTKWMEPLRQIAPSIKRVTVIFNPKTAPYYPLYLHAIEEAALPFAVEPIGVEVHDDAEIERAVNDAGRAKRRTIRSA